MNGKNLSLVKIDPGRNPHYVKIGKRIHQARVMAKETNSRALSLRLGWSAGRIHNYETGLSTPGVEETLQLCSALGINPGWLTYGIGAPRPTDSRANRYRKFIDALEQAEREGDLEKYLAAIKLTPERMVKFRNNPDSKIPDLMARRCEKYLRRRRGWIDEPAEVLADQSQLPVDAQVLLDLYRKLSPRDRKKFYAIGELLLP